MLSSRNEATYLTRRNEVIPEENEYQYQVFRQISFKSIARKQMIFGNNSIVLYYI